jgi:hypothetical protein
MTDLSFKVDHHDIVVSKFSVGLSVTCRKQGRIIEAIQPLPIDPSAAELIFLVRACEAAFAKAQSLGCLYCKKTCAPAYAEASKIRPIVISSSET